MKKPYLEAYINELPEKYKGADPPQNKIHREKSTGVAKSSPIPYTTSEIKSLNSETQKLRLQDDEQWAKVKTFLEKLGFCPRHVSKFKKIMIESKIVLIFV